MSLRCRRPDLARERTTGEVEGSVLSLMFRVKVLGFVIIEGYPDDGPEKCGDDRHVAMLANGATDSLTAVAFSRAARPERLARVSSKIR